MVMKNKRIYINGYLEPLESKYDGNYSAYQYFMIPINTKATQYSVNSIGKENEEEESSQFDILKQVELFNNRESSSNITDLFSTIIYDCDNNKTRYNHYSEVRYFNFCPNKLGLLDFNTSNKPLALNKIGNYVAKRIICKEEKLLNALVY